MKKLFLFFVLCPMVGCSQVGGGADAGPDRLALDEPLGAGQVRAGIIAKESELLSGVDAHGWIGDFKLYNNRVAFIVENISEPRGWMPYGGTLLDAARVGAEGQEGEELFEEMAINIDLMTLYPDEAEVVNDGSDGQPALVRIRGEQRGIPLVDAAVGGALEPKNLDIVQDYILEPDADYLRIRTSFQSRTASSVSLQVGDLVLNGDRTADFFRGAGISDEYIGGKADYFGGFAPDLCYLYTGAEGGIQSALSIESITPMVIAEGQAPPRRDENQFVVERLLIVGAGGMDACLRTLADVRQSADAGLLGGKLTDADGKPEPGAIVLARDNSLPEGNDYVNQTYTDADGNFEMQLTPGSYRLEFRAAGRDTLVVEAPQVSAAQSSSLDASMPAPARLHFSCTGEDRDGGQLGPVPCKLSLQAGLDADRHASVPVDLVTFGVAGSGKLILPAGEWTATLSRGWEYSIVRKNITAETGVTIEFEGVLRRQVDTSGYIAADLHNHSTRSIDSTFQIEDKIASNACEGLDLVVLTDHDCQSDFTPQVERMIKDLPFDLHKWVRFVTGNEISPMYAHHTAFPLPTHPSGWIYWQVPWTLYDQGKFVRFLEYPEILARDRELGAEVINVAHPLSSSGYFNYLGFDPPDVMPRIDSLDPIKFTSDFDTIELLNSKDVNEMLDRILPMWCALNNQGMFRTASGVSDSHQRGSEAGFGRTMVASSAERADLLDLQEIWENLRQHHAMVGGGIFVRLSIGDAAVGDLVSLSGAFDVHLHVEAADWVPVERVDLLANGEIVATFDLAQPGQVDAQHPAVRFDGDVAQNPAADTWYAAVARGPDNDRLDPVFRGARAVGMTNAIRVDIDGNGTFDPPDK